MKPAALPILILNPHGRCNCRCTMCDIWKETAGTSLSLSAIERQMADFERLGLQWVVLSGGEALMHPDIFSICRLLHSREIRVTVLSTGLLLERFAASVAAHVDEVVVSLDGPEAVHDRIRGVPGAFRRTAAGVAAVRRIRGDYPFGARSTVQRANLACLRGTVEAARAMGLDSISFLAADVRSAAFNHPNGWMDARREAVIPDAGEMAVLEQEIEGLIDAGECGRFVRESPAKLRRILRHWQAEAGLVEPAAPMCNAALVSAVVEADGTVRPCFFHEPVGRVGAGQTFLDVWGGEAAVKFRGTLDVETNETCRRCVCSLNWTGQPAACRHRRLTASTRTERE